MINNKKQIACDVYKKDIISIDYLVNIRAGFLTHVSTRLMRTSCLELNKIKNRDCFLLDASHYFYLLSKGDMYWIDKVCSVYVKTGSGVWSSASAGKRVGMYLTAMAALNEETEYKIWKIIVRQVNIFTNYWITLENRKRFGLPLKGGKGNILQRTRRLYSVLRTCF